MKKVKRYCSECGQENGTEVVPSKVDASTDVGKFRAALDAAGFLSDRTIYNDKRKKFRRLKLWHGNEVTEAALDKRVQLVDNLITQFGDRLLAVHDVPSSYIWGSSRNGRDRSVIVKLKD